MLSSHDAYDPSVSLTIETDIGYNAFKSDFHYKFYKALKTGYFHSKGEGYWTAIKSVEREFRVRDDYQELLQLGYHATDGIICSDNLPVQEVDDSYIIKRIRQIVQKEKDFVCQFDFYNELKELVNSQSEVVRLESIVQKQERMITQLTVTVVEQKNIIAEQKTLIEKQEKHIEKVEGQLSTVTSLLAQLMTKFDNLQSTMQNSPSHTREEEEKRAKVRMGT